MPKDAHRTTTAAVAIDELPHNEEAERNLIALALLRKCVPAGARSLATTDFYKPEHRETWSAFLELEADGREVEPLTAHDIIRRNRPDLAERFPVSSLVGVTIGMVDCSESVFVERIRNASVRRHILRKLDGAARLIERGTRGAIETLRRELADLDALESSTGAFRSLADVMERDVKPALHDLAHGVTGRISTGFRAIDRCIGGGLSLSDVLLVAGLPGGGKSALVLQMAVGIAKQGNPVAVLSGEMSDRENALRLISQAGGMHNLNAVTHLGDSDLRFALEWADDLKGLPIFFDSRSSDLRSVSAAMQGMVERHGVKVLVIDYIQLLRLNRFETRQSRSERIAECSQEVKRIAMQHGVAVVEVGQFNREGAKSGKPSMHDLEGSGQLEKDASLIFVIDADENFPERVTIRIAKGRNAGTSAIEGRFYGSRLTFEF